MISSSSCAFSHQPYSLIRSNVCLVDAFFATLTNSSMDNHSKLLIRLILSLLKVDNFNVHFHFGSGRENAVPVVR